jgi:hypothetical protein
MSQRSAPAYRSDKRGQPPMSGYLLCDCTRYIGANLLAGEYGRRSLSIDLRLVIRSSAYQASGSRTRSGVSGRRGRSAASVYHAIMACQDWFDTGGTIVSLLGDSTPTTRPCERQPLWSAANASELNGDNLTTERPRGRVVSLRHQIQPSNGVSPCHVIVRFPKRRSSCDGRTDL